MSTELAKLVAGALGTESFTLVDVGCSGGLPPAWRVFGERLRAIGFDASVEACERLARDERHPGIQYMAGFAGLPPEHPLEQAVAGKPPFSRSPLLRLSAWRLAELQRERVGSLPLEEKLSRNAWDMTRLADPAKPIVVPDVLEALGWSDIDFLKIDIDGADFRVLTSFDGKLDELGMLAVQLEVNFFGGTEPWEHTFANTDRFMRERGFELLGLEVRTYSISAMPAPFAITAPAQTVSGRPIQGEAYYARDPVALHAQAFAATMSAEKLAKLAAIFSIWSQPDSAAELLISFRDRLQGLLDVDEAVEVLARQAQAQAGLDAGLSYASYIAAFEAGAPLFFPPPAAPLPPPPTIGRRISAAIRSFRNPDG